MQFRPLSTNFISNLSLKFVVTLNNKTVADVDTLAFQIVAEPDPVVAVL